MDDPLNLGIILAFYRNKETVNIDEMNLMRWYGRRAWKAGPV